MLALSAPAAAICGDGVLEGPAEQCDDGNVQNGDCCSALCLFESAGSTCDLDACNENTTCDGAGSCGGGTPLVCDDGLLCNGAESCDPGLGCQPGAPGLGALFRGDIVVGDPRDDQPSLGGAVWAVDPVSGAVEPISQGGMLVEPYEVAVESNRCVLVPDAGAVIRIDPLAYDPANPGDNQTVIAAGGSLFVPRGITLAPDGTIYVTDHSSNHRVHRIDPDTGAQEIVAEAGHLDRPRRITFGPDGQLYVPIPTGNSRPGIVRIDPDAYDPFDLLANQEIVASDGAFVLNNGPWDVEFAPDGRLILIHAQEWNVFRIDVNAYDPLDPASNQERVADEGGFIQIRGVAVEEDGQLIVTNEGGTASLIRVDADAFDPLDPASNQSVLHSGAPMLRPRGAFVVGVGRCGNGTLDPGEQCDDGNETDGDCCSALCGFESSGSTCSVDACTQGTLCDGAGSCGGGSPVICDDAFFCNGAESCDPALGCQAGAPPPTDDGVACTDDSCDESADVVVHSPNHGFCDNALFCDGSESCDPVLDCQAGTPPPIDDGVACTDDSCDENADVVVHAPNHGSCDNGLFCDGSESCDPVLDCQAGTPPPIDDSVACTDDSCDENADVVVHSPDHGSCDNGLFCDGSESCDPVLDCQAGTPPSADDGVGCTDEICDEVSDTFSSVPNDALCDDGLLCSGTETCDPVLDCQDGAPGLGALFRGDIVVGDPRDNQPALGGAVWAVDPVSGAVEPISQGGMLVQPYDVAVEENRCVIVPDIGGVLRIDPLAYDPGNPGANQTVLTSGGDIYMPRGVTLAPDGTIYVTDFSGNHRIHRIDPDTGASEIVAEGGHLDRPRRITIGPDGRLYVPIPTGNSRPAVVGIGPDFYDPLDPFANQQIVASDGAFVLNNGPWDVDFTPDGGLMLIHAQNWNVFRIQPRAYDPFDAPANQELVADGGGFIQIRGIAVEEDGQVIVTNEGGVASVIRVGPRRFDPLNPASNQSVIASGPPMQRPRGADVVGIGRCGNGVIDPGEQCDDRNETDGDCCSAVCTAEPEPICTAPPVPMMPPGAYTALAALIALLTAAVLRLQPSRR